MPAPPPLPSIAAQAPPPYIPSGSSPVYIPPAAPPMYISADGPPVTARVVEPEGHDAGIPAAIPIEAGMASDPLVQRAYTEGTGAVVADEPEQTIIVAVGDETAASRPEISEGSLYLPDGSGGYVSPFPLQKTVVRGRIDGFLARTEVRQTFGNPHPDPIEAVYCFPLPVDAGVHELEIRIGRRRIVGIVRPRAEAERLYAEARAEGRVATLLSQERPNVFTQSVANVEPGASVEVRLCYVHTLAFDAGTFEYVFPMVVGPRHVAGSPFGPAAGSPAPGGGIAADTDLVPDASRISPPLLAPTTRDAAGFDLSVEIDAGMPIREVTAPTHGIVVDRPSPTTARVVLSSKEPVANRDFVLRYAVAPAGVAGAAFVHEGAAGSFAALMLVPPVDSRDVDAAPREVIFVLDTSGSMVGIPLQMERDIVTQGLETLRPGDRFNIVRFAGDASMLASRPIAADAAGIARGRAFLQGLSALGSTEMLPALQACLSTPSAPGAVRYVCFLTDGFVGYEGRIFETVQTLGADARWLVMGIGSSVNRYLIDGIAERGRGAAHYVLPRGGAEGARSTSRFLALLHAPVLTDVTLDAGELPLEEVPRHLPDLFPGQPLTLVARSRGPLDGVVTIRGTAGGRPVAVSIPVSDRTSGRNLPELAHLWARRRLEALVREAEVAAPLDAEIRARAERLAVDFDLVSAFTSFVAVDDARIVGNGRPVRVLQPVAVPESASAHATAGEEPVGRPVLLDAWGSEIALSATGEVVFWVVRPGASVAAAGVRDGDVIATVDGVRVSGMRHLEALLLQGDGEAVVVGLGRAGDPASRPRIVRLPRP